jgi:hypothetical protein
LGDRSLDDRPIPDPFLVDRSWDHGRSGKTESSAGLVKSWIFDPRDLARIYEGHRADRHRLLCSGCDHDLIRMTARTPEVA